MSPLQKALPLILLLAGALLGQGTPYDCAGTAFTWTASTSTTVVNTSNGTPCRFWAITFSSTGTLNSTLTFSTSPDNSSFTNVPNSQCTGATQQNCWIDGANPIPGTSNGTASFVTYAAYVRVSIVVNSGSGTGTVKIYGYKGLSARTRGGGGSSGGSMTVAGTANQISTSGTCNDTAGTCTVALASNAIPCQTAANLGLAVNDTDQTAAINTLASTAQNPNGLCIALQQGDFLRADGQLTPYSGWISTDSVIGPVPALRITSSCPTQGSGLYEDHPFAPDCARLDLRFHASGLSRYNQGPKLFASGRGILEIDHVTIGDWGTDTAAYILTTGSSLRIHDCRFLGSLTFTSTTSFLIGTGSKAFTVASGVTLAGTPQVFIQSHANQSNWMYGTLTSYSGTTLTVNVTITSGSGTFADWDIRIPGASNSDQAIVFGGFPGTSCCAGDTTDPYAGYNSYVQNNIFENFQRVLLVQPFANGLVISGNQIRGGNTSSPGDIFEYVGGATLVTITGNIIANNLFEMSSVSSNGKDYAEAILLQGSQGFQIYGNTMYDGNGTTCLVIPNGTKALSNNIRQNYIDSGKLICATLDSTNHTDLTGITSSVGGGALGAGACASTALTLTGVAPGMAAVATPATYPGDGNYWLAYVSASDTVTVKVCAAVAGTPTASTYTVVMQ